MMQSTLPPRFAIQCEGTRARLGRVDGRSGQRGSERPSAKLALIVGCSRSGTTWLYRMLRRMPGVSGLGEAQLGARLRELGVAPGANVEVTAKSAVVLEKTPANVYDLECLASVRDGRAINLIRDPRAVVASMLDASQSWAESREGFNAQVASQLWLRAVDEAERGRRWWGNRLTTLRYEDLVDDPHTQLTVACHMLGLRVTKNAVERAVERETFHKRAVVADAGAGRFLRFGAKESWREELSCDQVAVVEETVGDRLTRYGYRPFAS